VTTPASPFVGRLLSEIANMDGGLPAAADQIRVGTEVISALARGNAVSEADLIAVREWLAARVTLRPEEDADFRRIQAGAFRIDRTSQLATVPGAPYSPQPDLGRPYRSGRRRKLSTRELALFASVVILVIALAVVVTVLVVRPRNLPATQTVAGSATSATTGAASPVAPSASSSSTEASPVPSTSPTVTSTAATASTSPSSTVPPGVPGTYHQGPLFLTGDDVDLDAPPGDPQWGELNLMPGDSYDIHGSGNTAIFTDNNAEAVQLGPKTGNSCFTATGYSSTRIGIDTPPIIVGQLICVRTTEGHFSLLKVISLPSDGIQLSVITYDATAS
jgi:hypothetical protein